MREEVRFLASLIELYSPTGKVDDAVRFLLDKLEEFELNPRIMDGGAILCEVGSGGGGILLCGHLDTVPGRLPVKLDDRLISGRGAVDAKSSLASMIFALKKLRDFMKIYLLVSVDEEGDSESTFKAIQTLKGRVKYAIIGEPSRANCITMAYYGRLAVNLDFKGRKMHPSACIKMRNVLEESFKFYLKLKEEVLRTQNPISICPIYIHGGGEKFAPDRARIKLDLRFPPQVSFEDIRNVIHRVVEENNLENPVKCSSSISHHTPPYQVNLDSPLVKSFIKAIRSKLKIHPKMIRKVGTSDMNLIGNILSIPAIAYGPGNPRLSHMDVERV